MKREIIKIDEDLCNGCGLCVPNCHEGALQIIDGKVRLVSELMCDGLGACIGHCPEGAITIEEREAEPYDEVKVMELMLPKGKNTIEAHLRHLREHQEHVYLKQAISYLTSVETQLNFTVEEIKMDVHAPQAPASSTKSNCESGGCPGSKTVVFDPASFKLDQSAKKVDASSQLRQWPVQLHLINPAAAYFQNSDLLVASDCSAFSVGDFHQNWLKGKSLVIACPKLDQGKEIYVNKLISLIDDSKVNTISVMVMEVPCCGGLMQMVTMAAQRATRRVPVKLIVVSIKGEILEERWV